MQQGISFSIGERGAQGIPIAFKNTQFLENVKSSTFDTLATQKPTVNEANVDNELDFASYGKSDEYVEGVI